MIELLGVSLKQFISKPLIAIGLVLIIFGVVAVILAKRISRVARQSDEVSTNDKVYVTLKIIGLLLMLAGFICISVDIIIYIVNKH